MNHLFIFYPVAQYNQNAPLIQSILEDELQGRILRVQDIQCSQTQSLGYLSQLYWSMDSLDESSLLQKSKKSGWTPQQNATMTVLEWESPSSNASQDLYGTGAPLKCYLRYRIAATQTNQHNKNKNKNKNHHQTYGVFKEKYNEEGACPREWKKYLHSPDQEEDLVRLIPVFFHDSTRVWMKVVPWQEVIPFLRDWLRVYQEPLQQITTPLEWIWTVWGDLEERKKALKEMPKNGVYWCGAWMAIPPETSQEWFVWLQSSASHPMKITEQNQNQKGGKSLDFIHRWSHPATMNRRDLDMKNARDYVVSWKADGIHALLQISKTEWKLVDEKGDTIEKGKLTKDGAYFANTMWEGEFLAEKREFLAFDVVPEEPGSELEFHQRTQRVETDWKGREQTSVLWEGIPVGKTLTMLWKPSIDIESKNEKFDVGGYMKKVEKSGYGWDGLIWTPKRVSWHTFGRSPAETILKWKPSAEQTVDVLVAKGAVWLKQFDKKGRFGAPNAFSCGENGEQKRGMYPREWKESRLAPGEPIEVHWEDGSTIEAHDGEIWELRWAQTVRPEEKGNVWDAVRRREANKEVLVRNAGGVNAIVCQGEFVGPNAWKTMLGVEDLLLEPVEVKDLEQWIQPINNKNKNKNEKKSKNKKKSKNENKPKNEKKKNEKK